MDSALNGKIHRVNPQVRVVPIGKEQCRRHRQPINPARARHYGSEKIPELEIGKPRDWSVQGESPDHAHSSSANCCCDGLRRIKVQRIVECESDLLSHPPKESELLRRYRYPQF